MLIGYCRVSTEQQNLQMQIDALKKAGCEKIFSEKVSGAKREREEFDKMKKFLRSGSDTVVVYKLDRLGRSLKNLIEEVQWFDDREIGFKSIKENIDTTSPTGKLFFHIFGALAEFERNIIRERTMDGLNAARARGRLGGRKPKLTSQQIEMVNKLHENKTSSIQNICETFNIKRSTLYRALRKTA